MVKQKQSDLGIPKRFKLNSYCSRPLRGDAERLFARRKPVVLDSLNERKERRIGFYLHQLKTLGETMTDRSGAPARMWSGLDRANAQSALGYFTLPTPTSLEI